MRTREVSSGNNVLLLSPVFNKCPVVEIVAERALVVSATRMVGSGPARVEIPGVMIAGVVGAGCGH